MSVNLTSRVWSDSGCGSNELLVLLAIANQADDENLSQISVSGIAKMTGLSSRTVFRSISSLRRSMHLDVVHQARGRFDGNIYRVSIGPQS